MRLEIRPWTAADQPGIEDLWVEAWRSAMPEIDFEARRPWLRAHLERLRSEGTHVFVASDATGPLGFVSVADDGYVDQLAVGAAHQNRGLGAQLLAAARAGRTGPLRLSVNLGNPGAVAFYRKQGFRETGRSINPNSGLPIIHMAECGP